MTTTPRLESLDQKYAAFYLFKAVAKTKYRASIGRAMTMPYRDPQTGRIHQRQRIVWTALPQIHEIDSDYNPQDRQSQVYAGLELYEESVKPFLPIDTNYLRDHARTNVSEESFQMTEAFAQAKLKERIVEHVSQIAREMLMQEYGASVKINEISVDVTLRSTQRVFYPTWIFTSTTTTAGRPLKTLVSGVDAKVSGLKTYDPTLSGALSGATVASTLFFVFGSPVFSFLMLGISYLAASTVAKWLPIWRTMRWEGRRAADVLANQQYGGQSSGFQGSAGFGDFNPFEAFMGGRGSRSQGQDPFSNYDPFAGAGSFNGQRRSSDPFYESTQKASNDLYRTLGVSKSASQDEITAAFRKLALTKHPDKVPAEQKANASHEFAKINEAYKVLRNVSKRQQYDRYGVI
ncbi:DnaJ domain protein [Taphrina deformans PYCC 5710]|uniref:DnaJ domain protein n=1 Tax=Taphrina deformans (strain PYCC 5710 / ATCC 11124 / CBS 356.35 / IMI 108563 / JCM 9778 / NBRC 8474) TaxID=1097556 RepID=R4XD57_TAPDE|nr:DnaJ domain protein [Taphrina deformans PYCC 5710]|eukprot:CCG83533.1 DnaJ domain protein [Taphrina deformans PYCC 5710]